VIRVLLSVLVLVLCAGDLMAGPILTRLKARRQGALAPVPAANCPCLPPGPATVAPAKPLSASAPTPAEPERFRVPLTSPTPAVRYEYRRVCDGGVCKLVLVPVSP
jgi:hypothetical protein